MAGVEGFLHSLTSRVCVVCPFRANERIHIVRFSPSFYYYFIQSTKRIKFEYS